MVRSLLIVIPFKFYGAKSRLSKVLDPEGRQALSLAMLQDVLEAVSGKGRVTILSRPGFDGDVFDLNVELLASPLGLNEALNWIIDDQRCRGWREDLLIVMADLALITPEDIQRMIETPGDVVLSPGKGGGTNMILLRDPRFRTCYRGVSYPRHLDLARKLGLSVGYYSSSRTILDIDDPEDLQELMSRGTGRGKRVLEAMIRGKGGPSTGEGILDR